MSDHIDPTKMNCSHCETDIDDEAPVVVLTRNRLDFNDGWQGCIVHVACAPLMDWKGASHG